MLSIVCAPRAWSFGTSLGVVDVLGWLCVVCTTGPLRLVSVLTLQYSLENKVLAIPVPIRSLVSTSHRFGKLHLLLASFVLVGFFGMLFRLIDLDSFFSDDIK